MASRSIVLFSLLFALPVVSANPLTDLVNGLGGFITSFSAGGDTAFTALFALALFVVYLLLFQIAFRSFVKDQASPRLINAGIIVFSAILAIFSAASIPPAALVALQAQYQVAGFILLSAIPLAIIGGAFYIANKFKNVVGKLVAGLLLIVLGSNLNSFIEALEMFALEGAITWISFFQLVIIGTGVWMVFSAFSGSGSGSSASGSGSGGGGGLDKVKNWLKNDINQAERARRGEVREAGTLKKEYKDTVKLGDLSASEARDLEHVDKFVEAILHYAHHPEAWKDNISRIRDLYAKFHPKKYHVVLKKRVDELDHAAKLLIHDDSLFQKILRAEDRTDKALVRKLKNRIDKKFDAGTGVALAPDDAEDMAQEIFKRHRLIVNHYEPEIHHLAEESNELIHSVVEPAKEAADGLKIIAEGLKTAIERFDTYENKLATAQPDAKTWGESFAKACQDLIPEAERVLHIVIAIKSRFEKLVELEETLSDIIKRARVQEMSLLHMETLEKKKIGAFSSAVQGHFAAKPTLDKWHKK